jgi:type II secretory ATPase GspE/PulE/Tfp pilus assembly ATPase PilB-like protein
MGIEPFLIASTLNVIVAQRLVRKLNTKYMESYLPTKGEIDRLMMGLTDEEKKDLNLSERSIRLYRPKTSGIPEGHEYEGRIGIFEVMEISEDIKSLIMSRTNSDLIRKAARANHMHSMYYDGLQKALEGLTTIEEIFKATLV